MDRSTKGWGPDCALNTWKQDRLWSGTTLKHVEVERVQRPDFSDGFRFSISVLTLIQVDHQAQSATYEIAEIVVKDYRKFGPPLAENDWFDLARCMASEFMSEGARDEIVKEAEQEVKAHGLGASVLTRIVNLREEGSEQAALASLRGTVNHDRWQNVWLMEGTDRKEVLAHITEKSGRLVDGLSQELEATSRSSMKIDVQEEREMRADFSKYQSSGAIG